jgi:hypothetical protein
MRVHVPICICAISHPLAAILVSLGALLAFAQDNFQHLVLQFVTGERQDKRIYLGTLRRNPPMYKRMLHFVNALQHIQWNVIENTDRVGGAFDSGMDGMTNIGFRLV